MTLSKTGLKIAIGIYIDSFSGTEHLFKTLFFLASNTRIEYKIVLLTNGAIAEVNREIRNTLSYPNFTTFSGLGRTRLFNNFIDTQADYYVYMECGVLVSPKAIDQILEFMVNSPTVGIIGPTLNNCWNQQSIFDDSNPQDINIQERANKLKQQQQPEYREIDSLSEAIMIIRKEVVKKIGHADEKYANNYYWEADYCVRAKKAGFKTVWAKNIYVHRILTETNKNRQASSLINSNYFRGKFCSGSQSQKRQCHACKGFLCEYFATGGNYKLKIAEGKPNDYPLVSCIMPTKNRAKLLQQSVKYFHTQDYPNKELIIVYDNESDLPQDLHPDNNIRIIKVKNGGSIGNKRNLACLHASGEIIMHWDDDDWYSRNRISEQVNPILKNQCDITGLNNALFYLPEQNEFWRCTEKLSKKMLLENVHGGTLAYNKAFWNKKNHYPDTSLREDADFMSGMIKNGAQLRPMDGSKLFMYLRHGNNSWTFKAGSFMEPDEWKKVGTPNAILNDMDFYKSMFKGKGHKEPPPGTRTSPMVTCIMPTANRREFIPRAIRYFQNQIYQNKELLIIDDGEDKIEDLVPKKDGSIRYFRLEKKITIGEKRNMACREAVGEIIVHWDDDDWMSPGWIQFQVDSLLKESADVTGLDRPFFFQPKTFNFWQYHYPKTERPWVHGGTLCYKKSFWQRNPFKAINIGEDARFIWNDSQKKIIPHSGTEHYVGFIHGKNVSPKHISDKRWRKVNPELLRKYSQADILNTPNYNE